MIVWVQEGLLIVIESWDKGIATRRGGDSSVCRALRDFHYTCATVVWSLMLAAWC
jgi:hypothetical protein